MAKEIPVYLFTGFLEAGKTSLIQETMQDLLKKRNEKQPVNMPSAGSFFKRPVGAFAGKLIEDAGRLNVPGRPIQYRTTPDFLRTFGLSSLEDLPAIEKVNLGEPDVTEEEKPDPNQMAIEEV